MHARLYMEVEPRDIDTCKIKMKSYISSNFKGPVRNTIENAKVKS